MPTCSFCKKNYTEPRGLTVYGFDGKAMYFCSTKCRKNLNLKRDPKKVNWIKRDKKVKKVIEKKVEEKKEIVEEKKPETKKEEVNVTQLVEKKEEEKKNIVGRAFGLITNFGEWETNQKVIFIIGIAIVVLIIAYLIIRRKE